MLNLESYLTRLCCAIYIKLAIDKNMYNIFRICAAITMRADVSLSMGPVQITQQG